MRFEVTVPEAGSYEVRLAYAQHRNRATNVPVPVLSAESKRTVIVNQRLRPLITGRFISLGNYRCAPGKTTAVIINTTGTDGYVVADAVHWTRQVAPSCGCAFGRH